MVSALLAAALLAYAQAPGDPEEDLRRLNDEPSSAARSELARSLAADPKDKRAYEALAAAAENDLSPDVRIAAARGLLAFPERSPVAFFERLLRTEEAEPVRIALCESLAQTRLDDPEVSRILGEISGRDPSPPVREAALRALKSRGIRAKAAKKKRRTPRGSSSSLKGKGRCGNGNGWCKCSFKTLSETKPQCMSYEDCMYAYHNSYERLDYECRWDGRILPP